MKKFLMLTVLLSINTVYSLDFLKPKNIIDVSQLTVQEKKDFIPIYQEYCAKQFRRACSSYLWRGIPATLIGALVGYYGMSLMGQAGAGAMQDASRMSSPAGAISYMPVGFALDSRSWAGFGLICAVAVPCFLYAGCKLVPVISRFITSRAFYTNALRGFDGAVREALGNPKVQYEACLLDWKLYPHGRGALYDGVSLHQLDAMKEVFQGKWDCHKVVVPMRHKI